MSECPSPERADGFTRSPGRQDPYLRLQSVTVFVRDLDRSLRFYVDQLGFGLVFDGRVQSRERFVTVAPPDGAANVTLVAPEPNSEARKLIGRSTRVTFVTDDLVAYCYTTAHQPGAKYAAASFITGYLNIPIEESFAQLTQPILLIWGKEAKITPVEDAHTFKRLNPRAQVEIIEGSRLLPQDEQANLFNQKVIQWLRQETPARAR